MQSYLSEMLAGERIADLRRDADRHRLATVARVTARRGRRGRGGARRRGLVARQPGRAAV
jgi:hypothetical protein